VIVCTTIEQMRALVRRWRRAGESIGFVPTMGYLHEGHMSLVDVARADTDHVVLSIYVNPTQFGPNEDLATYPRDFARDEALCVQRGVEAVFYPDTTAMYAPDHSTWVHEDQLSVPLCGRARAGHFRGVTTVVAKLFNIVQPDMAVFGRKDAQQALVIERMVRDLDIPVEIRVAPIVRETDGLALSSRNKYLSPVERRNALSLSRGLRAAEAQFTGGERDAAVLVGTVVRRLEEGGGRIDYVELLSRDTLQPLTVVDRPAVLAVAVFQGTTRLIDNAFLDA